VVGPDAYLELIRRMHASVEVPIIGSLNGYTSGGWLEYAKHIEEAGASALELNLYVVSNLSTKRRQKSNRSRWPWSGR